MNFHSADYESALGKLPAEEMERLATINLIESNNAQQELFAQVMASKLGGCSFPRDQALIRKVFPRVWSFIFAEE